MGSETSPRSVGSIAQCTAGVRGAAIRRVRSRPRRGTLRVAAWRPPDRSRRPRPRPTRSTPVRGCASGARDRPVRGRRSRRARGRRRAVVRPLDEHGGRTRTAATVVDDYTMQRKRPPTASVDVTVFAVPHRSNNAQGPSGLQDAEHEEDSKRDTDGDSRCSPGKIRVLREPTTEKRPLPRERDQRSHEQNGLD